MSGFLVTSALPMLLIKPTVFSDDFELLIYISLLDKLRVYI